MNSKFIVINPEILSGTPVFIGTRVPIQILFDYLKAGDSIDNFLDGFPTVKKEVVIAVIEEIQKEFLRKAA